MERVLNEINKVKSIQIMRKIIKYINNSIVIEKKDNYIGTYIIEIEGRIIFHIGYFSEDQLDIFLYVVGVIENYYECNEDEISEEMYEEFSYWIANYKYVMFYEGYEDYEKRSYPYGDRKERYVNEGYKYKLYNDKRIDFIKNIRYYKKCNGCGTRELEINRIKIDENKDKYEIRERKIGNNEDKYFLYIL